MVLGRAEVTAYAGPLCSNAGRSTNTYIVVSKPGLVRVTGPHIFIANDIKQSPSCWKAVGFYEPGVGEGCGTVVLDALTALASLVTRQTNVGTTDIGKGKGWSISVTCRNGRGCAETTETVRVTPVAVEPLRLVIGVRGRLPEKPVVVRIIPVGIGGNILHHSGNRVTPLTAASRNG